MIKVLKVYQNWKTDPKTEIRESLYLRPFKELWLTNKRGKWSVWRSHLHGLSATSSRNILIRIWTGGSSFNAAICVWIIDAWCKSIFGGRRKEWIKVALMISVWENVFIKAARALACANAKGFTTLLACDTELNCPTVRKNASDEFCTLFVSKTHFWISS